MKNQIISAYRTAAQVGGKRYWTARFDSIAGDAISDNFTEGE